MPEDVRELPKAASILNRQLANSEYVFADAFEINSLTDKYGMHILIIKIMQICYSVLVHEQFNSMLIH